MVKYKGKSIIRQHIKSKSIKWEFKMCYRLVPKTGYIYELDIYAGRKQATEFGLPESVILQQTEKLNRSFCRIFSDNFFASPLLLKKLTENLPPGIGVVPKNWKLLPEIEKGQKKAPKEEKQKKAKQLVHDSSFKSEEIFNLRDSNFLISKDLLVAL